MKRIRLSEKSMKDKSSYLIYLLIIVFLLGGCTRWIKIVPRENPNKFGDAKLVYIKSEEAIIIMELEQFTEPFTKGKIYSIEWKTKYKKWPEGLKSIVEKKRGRVIELDIYKFSFVMITLETKRNPMAPGQKKKIVLGVVLSALAAGLVGGLVVLGLAFKGGITVTR